MRFHLAAPWPALNPPAEVSATRHFHIQKQQLTGSRQNNLWKECSWSAFKLCVSIQRQRWGDLIDKHKSTRRILCKNRKLILQVLPSAELKLFSWVLSSGLLIKKCLWKWPQYITGKESEATIKHVSYRDILGSYIFYKKNLPSQKIRCTKLKDYGKH